MNRHVQIDPTYPPIVTFGRHPRRRAHRIAPTPRRAWRRTYTVKEERAGWPLTGFVFRTPISSDAPYSDEDAHFWDWVLTGLLVAVLVGGVISLLVAFL